MERIPASLAACLLSILAAGVAVADTRQFALTLPLNNIDNPRVAGAGGIDGSLDLKGLARASAGATFLQVSASGKGSDAGGRRYQLGGNAKFAFHDPLPPDVTLRLRMTRQGGIGNAGLLLALHVNEQGLVAHVADSGVECGG